MGKMLIRAQNTVKIEKTGGKNALSSPEFGLHWLVDYSSRIRGSFFARGATVVFALWNELLDCVGCLILTIGRKSGMAKI
jgi:hypothetical protein